MIKWIDGTPKYYDKNGTEITERCEIRMYDRTWTVYRCESGELGVDSTNPVWIEKGWAAPCEYGLYPLEEQETEIAEVI